MAEPQVCRFVSDRSIKEVACGGNHSVFLLEDGEVYTCGVNTKGQLGHEREGNKPGECHSCLVSRAPLRQMVVSHSFPCRCLRGSSGIPH